MYYLSGLNEQQREAVTAPVGPTVVLAGAGSGKTRVLTHRILHLIQEGESPGRILAVTFTNKAAKEMGERVNALIGEMPGGTHYDARPLVTTFHSLGVRILREFHREIGLNKYFPIYDRADSMKIVKDAMKELDIDTKHIEPRMILGAISKKKGEGGTASALLEKRSQGYVERNVAEIWYRYEQALKKAGACDFDDLIIRPLHLLRENEMVRTTLQERFGHLLIDEYQDTNEAQAEIADWLVKKHNSIFVVGDIDQNIYSWRGATIENLLSFEEQYPNSRLIILEQNYRSTKTIVDAANAVIEKNVRRKDKRAFTENPGGDPIRLLVCSSEREEAHTIAGTCRDLMNEGMDPSKIAILYRTNFQSRVLEEAMLHANIPYQVLGTKFFDRKEVKDVMSYVRLLLNPDSQADLARIMNVPARGIGKVTQLAVLSGKTEELSAGPRSKVEGFFTLIDRLRSYIHTQKPSDVIGKIIEESGMRAHYEEKKGEDEERLDNIRELVSLALQYDHAGGLEGLQLLLDDATLMSEQDNMSEELQGVKLMTIHAAKGLEFETVFVTGLEEGLFPHERDEQDDDEEERRLFYVAITRAHNKLFLTLARTRRIFGTLCASTPSSFIGDIPENYMIVEDGDTYGEPIIS